MTVLHSSIRLTIFLLNVSLSLGLVMYIMMLSDACELVLHLVTLLTPLCVLFVSPSSSTSICIACVITQLVLMDHFHHS